MRVEYLGRYFNIPGKRWWQHELEFMGGGVWGENEMDVYEICKVNFTGFSDGSNVEWEGNTKPP